MLRNSVQIALCGLVTLTACTSTRPLLVAEHTGMGNVSCDVRIVADPYVEYRLLGALSGLLHQNVPGTGKYIVTIEITEKTSAALYTVKQSVKDQMRMIAKVNVYDAEYNKMGAKVFDVYTTYEVSDELPVSGVSSQMNARNSAINELAHATALAVREIVESG